MSPPEIADPTTFEPDDHGKDVSHIEPDNISVGVLTVLFAFVAVSIVLVAVLLQAWFYNWKVDLLSERRGPIDAEQTPAAIAKIQLEQINKYGWVDPKTKKDLAIPISRAMELVVKEYAADSKAPAANGKETSTK